MIETFYSHGKLLLSAEYLVVDGAQALAVPCKFGQDLVVKNLPQKNTVQSGITLLWKSYTKQGQCWFNANFILSFKADNVLVSSTQTTPETQFLSQLLQQAFLLGANCPQQDLEISTHLEFHRDWGLGSSSTLIANVAQWLKVDPFKLFFASATGSGYDIACATAKSAILYQRNNDYPEVEPITWNPPFADQLYFVHLGQKQKSDREVKSYNSLSFDRGLAVKKMNHQTHALLNCKTLVEFEDWVVQHEDLMSKVLNRPTVKQNYFSDYPGAVKSLGAWGGDFVLVSYRENFKNYFQNKGLYTQLSFAKMVL